MTNLIRRSVIAGLAMLAAGPAAWAQDSFPSKPITLLVPFAAGSATDQLARALGQSLTEQTKQPVVVENKGGASRRLHASCWW